MPVSHAVRDGLHDLGLLLAEGHVIEIDLRVGRHEEVEVVAEDEGEAKDPLGLLKVNLHLLSLLLLQKQQIDLRLAHLHRHAVLARVHAQGVYLLAVENSGNDGEKKEVEVGAPNGGKGGKGEKEKRENTY